MELRDAYKSEGTLTGSTLVRGEKGQEKLCQAVLEQVLL